MQCHGLNKDGRPCGYPAKYQLSEKTYCKKHYTVASGSLENPIPVLVHSRPSLPKSDKSVSRSPSASTVLFNKLLCQLAGLTFVLVLTFFAHFYLKQYYYKYCESNILKVWLFKTNPVCVKINMVITTMENWSIQGLQTGIAHLTSVYANL
jgi:hypothetical protein